MVGSKIAVEEACARGLQGQLQALGGLAERPRFALVETKRHVNAVAALDWVFRRVPDPRRVFVTGCSAGSVGSILHAPRIIRQYPRAQVAQLGDSLGFLFSEPTDLRELWGADRVLPDWVPGVRAIPRDRFTTPRFRHFV